MNINNLLAHVIETSSVYSREGHLHMMDLDDLASAEKLLNVLSGDSSKGIQEIFGIKKILPRKNTGYFGLSATALGEDVRTETFKGCGFNFGLLIDHTDKRNCKVLVASALDCWSSCHYDKKEGSHKLSVEMHIGADKKLKKALDESGADRYPILKNVFSYEIDEKDLAKGNIKVDYSINDMFKYIKELGWRNYKNANETAGWNEVLCSANLKAVKGLFFSSDIDIGKGFPTAEQNNNFKYNTQAANVLMLKDYIKNRFGIDLPIYFYDRKEKGAKKLKPIDEQHHREFYNEKNLSGYVLETMKAIEEVALEPSVTSTNKFKKAKVIQI